jgi:hypothetical protein
MGCFLGVTDQWARASRGNPHTHEVGAARVDPGGLSCNRNQSAFDSGPPHQVLTPKNSMLLGSLGFKRSCSINEPSRIRPPENSAMRANKFQSTRQFKKPNVVEVP